MSNNTELSRFANRISISDTIININSKLSILDAVNNNEAVTLSQLNTLIGGLNDVYYTETEINNFFSGVTSITGYNKLNWNEAYLWGDHSLAGYALVSQLHDILTLGINQNGLSLSGQTLSLGLASTNTNGALSSTDWNIFNNKQNNLGFIPENISNKGQANGYAQLDTGAKLPISIIPDSVLGQVEYQGTWNATTNTPTLPITPIKKGDYYVVNTAGVFVSISFEVGDWIISNGSQWEKVDNTDAVSTVFGRLGNILALATDYNLFYVRHDINNQALNTTQQGNARTNINAEQSFTKNTAFNKNFGTVLGTVAEGNDSRFHAALTLLTPLNGLNLTDQQLSLDLASANSTGALSSTDWNTFNNKSNLILGETSTTAFRGDRGKIGYDYSQIGHLPLIGGTMTGNVNWAQTDRGIIWAFNTDGASIKFYNTGDGDTDSRLEFATLDNNNEYFRWVHTSSGITYEAMRLLPISNGNSELIVNGKIIKSGGLATQYLMANGSVSTLTNPVTGTGAAGQVAFWTGAGTQSGDGGLVWDNVNKRLNTNTAIAGQVTTTLYLQGVQANDVANEEGGASIFFRTSLLEDLGARISGVRRSGGRSALCFYTENTGANLPLERWRITETGIFQSNGAQTIQSSTGNLTLATGGGNGNILLSPNGTGDIRVSNTLSLGATGALVGMVGFNRNTRTGAILNNTYNAYQINNNAGLLVFEVYNSTGSTVNNRALVINGASNILVGTGVELSGGGRLQVSGTSQISYGTESLAPNISYAGLRLHRNNATSNPFSAGFLMTAFNNNGGFIGAGGDGIQFQTYTSSIATERMRITPTGNVGIGTIAPNGRLEVSGTEPNVTLRVNTQNTGISGSNFSQIELSDNGSVRTFLRNFRDGSGSTLLGYNDNLRFFAGLSTEIARFTLDGRLGIGTSNPGANLHVNTSSTGGDVFRITNGTQSLNLGVNNSAGGSYVFEALAQSLRFGTNNTERMQITSTGNVGINRSTNLSAKLTINYPVGTQGVLITNANDSAHTWLPFTNGTNYLSSDPQSGGSAALIVRKFESAQYTDLLTVNNNGRVGIGTESPSSLLHLNGAAELKFTNTANISGFDLGLLGGSNDSTAFIYQRANSSIAFGTNNTERLRITSAGNVGIGTTSPNGARLKIMGGALASNSSDSALFISSQLTTGRTGTYQSNTLSSIHNWFDDSTIEIAGGSTPSFISGISVTGNNASINSGTVRIITTGEERLRITNTGNVGIGTTSPSERLQIAGGNVRISGGTSGDRSLTIQALTAGDTSINLIPSTGGIGKLNVNGSFPLALTTNGTERLRVTQTGNVGIGTTSPAYKLDINSTSLTGFRLTTDGFTGLDLESSRTTGNLGGIRFKKIGDAATTNEFLGLVGGGFTFQTGAGTSNPTEKMRITPTGNVGIGTTNPIQILHLGVSNANISFGTSSLNDGNGLVGRAGGANFGVTGSALGDFTIRPESTKRLIFGTTATSGGLSIIRMIITSAGNVGIGNTANLTGGGKLQVSGETNSISFTNLGVKGTQSSNARNHFTQFNTGSSGIAVGWISSAFGDASGNRTVIGQYSGLAVLGSHNNNLTAWTDLIIQPDSTNGNIIIGRTTALTGGGRLQVGGDGRFTGDVIASSSSDQRLKNNLTLIPNSLEKITKLGGYSFEWNSLQETYTGTDYGIVAQEVEALFPEMVQTRESGMKAVKYDRLIPVMIEAIKELSREIKQLKENGK